MQRDHKLGKIISTSFHSSFKTPAIVSSLFGIFFVSYPVHTLFFVIAAAVLSSVFTGGMVMFQQ